MNLDTPLKNLAGIGQYVSYKLTRLELLTIRDLIYHFPLRYDDFSNATNIVGARVGQVVTIQGEVWSIKNIFTRSGKTLTQAVFNDGTSVINLTWFNSSWLTKQINTGDLLQVSGKLVKYGSKLSILMPKWEKLQSGPISYLPAGRQGSSSGKLDTRLHTGGLISVYPETAGLTSKWIRTKINQVLPEVLPEIKDYLPDFIKDKMLSLTDALEKIHFPKSWDDVKGAQNRLGFDELFFVSLATQKTRMEWDNKPVVAPLKIKANQIEEFIKKLPFELTGAQKKAINDILDDLAENRPMNRLIQGEVGSGKTVVCALIIYLVYLNGYKTLFMAPTEILAFQHFETITKLLKPFGIKVGIYTGSRKFKVNHDSIPDVIIGTHALLSDKLKLETVGLIIVDEQQRFGVQQRTILRSKTLPAGRQANLPHFLTTTATPIPRTIALTLYGDLDLSVINELPKERLKIKTFVVPAKKRDDAYKFIEKQIKKGGQVYIITPLIEESETLKSAKAATVEFERLKKEVFPNLRLDLLHGRMKSKEKSDAMQKFKIGETDILVSTSVVEVGVDVSNATIMLIESAERFGLSQLHQLRGRVGRGVKQSYCLLFPGDSGSSSRLKNMEQISDGLALAELDLKIRGAGEMFGKKQSGRLDFKIASLSDLTLVEKTKQKASEILSLDPTLDKYPLVQAQLRNLAPSVMPD